MKGGGKVGRPGKKGRMISGNKSCFQGREFWTDLIDMGNIKKRGRLEEDGISGCWQDLPVVIHTGQASRQRVYLGGTVV